ncbi:uncharacterized protein LOC128988211 isoform X2 [Macrosteles quadrilineatus]|uniref:uncharacterized protein LOC128988211 isoform X2 n=1 Tax=Macrosteles quadrilineatus TaxID=74068 RepID=UPI0023E19701|nr:uncharacterized protein LOC128988211 isoform X2 [Macrosteles quadrilineatus]
MEVVERAGGPFSRRNVQEWSRLDQITGLLEHARVETDHWTASTSNSSHHFGKVVDSRSRNLADGGQEQRQQTKQLEVFQTTVPGGSLQVIRSSTSSSWQSHKTLSSGSGWPNSERLVLPNLDSQDFDQLKLTLNPLDLSSQKSKASVGRSGSISSRRPPSRPRSIAGTKTEEGPDSRHTSELAAICHRVHEQAKKESENSGPVTNGFSKNKELTNDSTSTANLDLKTFRSTAVNEATRSSSDSTGSNNHISLIRKKSCSSEDLHTVIEDRNETDSNSSEWKRSSKVRRSLQFPPKQSPTLKETIVIPVTKSVAEIKREIEARKQLVTNSFRTNQWNNLAEIEGVLGVINNGTHEENPSKDDSDHREDGTISPTKTKKRQTFITVESLKEVRGRLRKLSSPTDEIPKQDDIDDGIDTEAKPTSPTPRTPDESSEIPVNSVKSYVYGMEVMLRKTKNPVTGTGSLESRSSSKSSTNGSNRSEEWYNRRKSYGFEQVSSQQSNYTSFEKSKIESSTDSGICRSSDTFPSWQKLSEKPSNLNSPIKTTHSIIIKPYSVLGDSSVNDIEGGTVVQKGRKTVVNLTNNTVNTSWAWNSDIDKLQESPKENSKQLFSRGKVADTVRNFHEKSNTDNQRLSEPITISIPIQQTSKTSHTDPSNLLLKQSKTLCVNDNIETSTPSPQNGITPYSELLFGKEIEESQGTEVKSLFDNIPWRGGRTKTLSNFFDSEFKRHSIAVDQAKYLATKKSYGSYNFNANGESQKKQPDIGTAVIPSSSDRDQQRDSTDSDLESSAHEKKQKRVEFCKTEVHFAAEPGRFNIVETDGKPPPTNLFRRRRKTTSDVPVRSGLPEIRFGDTQYEKNLLSTNERVIDNNISSELQTYQGKPSMQSSEEEGKVSLDHHNSSVVQNHALVPLTTHEDYNVHSTEDQLNQEDDMPKPRSILKNNIPKPKPYLLGESPDTYPSEDSGSWGVKLKSLKPDDESIKWQDSDLPKETEFQRLLKSLKPAASKPPDLYEIPPQSKQFSTAADNGLEVRITSSQLLPDHRRASWSVADRVKYSDEARGYSTKVNFGPQETTVVDSDKSSARFSSSEGLKSSWLINGQNSSFDAKPADQESHKAIKKLIHSQSFSTSTCQKLQDVYEGNGLKSTSLVLEIQNPSLNYTSEKKISVKDISTNLTRDNCERNFHKVYEHANKNSVSDKVYHYSRGVMAIDKEKKKTYHENTKTVPPIRKTSSTQTYFVNRSTIKKDIRQESSSKTVNLHSKSKPPNDFIEANNVLPGVLNALDDLSRCIDEVIIEYPQKVCKKDSDSTAHVFKVKEDHKTSNSSQNIMSIRNGKSGLKNQLDLLREIVDSGELSEDSLKADEEVRAYMSTDNDEDIHNSEWSGSWSRRRTLKQNFRDAAKIDLGPRISPSLGSRPNHRQGTEDAFISSSETPQVTSISLRQPNVSTTTVRPAAIYKASEVKHPVASFISRSILNTEPTGICSKVELSSSGERTWSFTKVSTNSVKSHSESDYLDSNRSNSGEKEVSSLFARDLTNSPSRLSRYSQSPSKESLFMERSAERNVLYNENNRQMSSSPTSGMSVKNTSLSNMKVDYNNKKSDKANITLRNVLSASHKSNGQNSSSILAKPKVEDKNENKKNDLKKVNGDIKARERKLSTSSSGRDGWLNTPKEAPVRRKLEPSFRKPEIKKENKPFEKPMKLSSSKGNLKRTESPIYQNREIYAERRDSNDNTETESAILEELTKAADQILLAVNGYTDDDSFRASSDDEYRKKREKVASQPLCTISELPTKKTNRHNVGVIKSTRSTDLRREYRSSSKTRIGKTSSNSSMESGDVKPLLSTEDRNKRRAARLLQRASSRELLFTTASSSEDIGSGSDTGSLRAKRVYRRPRLQNGRHGSKQDLTVSTAESKPKERNQRSSESRPSEAHKTQKVKVQSENRCSRHSKAVTERKDQRLVLWR